MKILEIRPEPHGSGSVIARFDIALTDSCRIYNLRLVQRPDGRRGIYSPQSGGRRMASFTPALSNEITRAAGDALLELQPLDRTAA